MRGKGLVVGALMLLLVGSLAGNWLLFRVAKSYYSQLNSVQLEPLGLERYSSQPIDDAAKRERPLVVFMGDSRAAHWIPPKGSHYLFANRGIAGQTSAQVLGRFTVHVSVLQPDIMVLQLGANDLKAIGLMPNKSGYIVSQLKSNIRALVDQAVAEGQKVILTTLFPYGDVPLARQLVWSDQIEQATLEVNQYLATLASEQVILLDAYQILGGQGGVLPAFSRDTLHLTSAGYGALNSELLTLLDSQ
jgi:lysophospholipase L1-like esterase